MARILLVEDDPALRGGLLSTLRSAGYAVDEASDGISGVFVDPDGNGVHGLDERVRVKSLLEGRTFFYRLVKSYGSSK